MSTLIGIIIGLLVLMALIVAHELGHFIAARRNGVKVNEFGVGFPPRAKAWVINPEYLKWQQERKKAGEAGKANKDKANKSGKTAKASAKNAKVAAIARPKKWLRLPKDQWDKAQKTLVLSINWLPIGGFCAMEGESDSDTKRGSFGAASLWAKTKILFAGVAMNWLVAFIILTVLAWTGMPQFISNQFSMPGDTRIAAAPVLVNSVKEDSPAGAAGFKTGDQIVQVDDTEVISATSVIDYGAAHAGEEVVYTVQRGADTVALPVTLNPAGAEYQLGVTMSQSSQTLYHSTWSAPIVGAVTTVQLTGETYRGLGEMVWNLISGAVSQLSFDEATRTAGQESLRAAGDSVSGPVGIIGVIFPAFSQTGPTNLAFLAALISVSLACMNVLPIPALDGGRWFLIMIYRLRGKKLTKETEEKIVSRAFTVLLILIAVITIMDVIKLF